MLSLFHRPSDRYSQITRPLYGYRNTGHHPCSTFYNMLVKVKCWESEQCKQCWPLCYCISPSGSGARQQ
ncbi:hypothetical protein AALO_G00028100 [Alosa alosa]|uniref:Uncharacterized protein n=1 Tax=Alosa alosa TaxID=278164 RepID=A0AAV6HEC9_9TELE|nr:hypothetical protein AALO_G00028100 [Alosa alosa]